MTPTVAIEFSGVSKRYPHTKTPALHQASFHIIEGDFVTILGPSGSGKTTLLKMINGLVQPDQGQIFYYGQDIASLDIIDLRRKMGYVIQEIGLFRHMTVAKNVAVVPDLLGWPQDAIDDRVRTLLDRIHLPYEDYHDRYPKELSGGQQQRVGLARALAANPKVMLLDEPFGALDAITRADLQGQLKELHVQEENRTFILITHDFDEALRLGERVMIIDKGEILQFGTPKEIVTQPKTPFVEALVATVEDHYASWRDLHD